MSEQINACLAATVLGLGVLLLCGWLDQQSGEDQACVVEVEDAYGRVHYISGEIADISKD